MRYYLFQWHGILPFEFLNYLSVEYTHVCDLLFYVNHYQCWYYKGLTNISSTVDETIRYLQTIIKKHKYEKILFLGTSAGGYASILFGV